MRAQWAAGGSDEYPINAADVARGVGPLIGRYLGDEYDGVTLTSDTGHPWAVCTCGFAQLYYEVAGAVQNGAPVPIDVLNAIVYHSNSLELSEQFDQGSGYERSVTNLTWSYAAFLLAIGAR